MRQLMVAALALGLLPGVVENVRAGGGTIETLLAKPWRSFPHDRGPYRYEGAALKRHWRELHRGDLQPYPSAEWLHGWLADRPRVRATIPGFDGDYASLAARLRDAWRLYHSGRFRRAYEAGRSLGLAGEYVAGRSWGVYAFYLAPDRDTRVSMLRAYMERLQALAEKYPEADSVNLHFGLAYAMGRYADEISRSKVLSMDLADRIRHHLEHVLDAHPNHFYALAGLGSWHAKVVAKAGSFMARLSYGATGAKAIECFETVTALAPELISPRVEYAEALRILEVNDYRRRAVAQLEKALERPAIDAQTRLEQDRARRMLQALRGRDE